MAPAQRTGSGVSVTEQGDTLPALVTVDWLKDRIGSPGLVLLDARVTREFPPGGVKRYVAAPARYQDEGHIPGAVFADVVSALSDPATGLNFTLPGTTALRDAFQALGVNAHSTIVAYDDDTGVWAARIWWLLRASGHRHVAVLNGGLKAWVREGGDLAHGPSPTPTPGDFEPADPRAAFVPLPDVERLSASSSSDTLLCALDHDVFTGERPSGAARDGHIPGSQSFPYSELLDEDGLIDPARVAPALAATSIAPSEAVVTYCGGGITACGVALALVAAGHPQVRIYDGSLQEWAADGSRPVEAGA
jgi:thiosulfate/3-mercaptopyruvate sulfurtransferase